MRFLTTLSLALATALTVAGCSQGGDGPEDGPVTITVQVSGEAEETAVYSAVAEAYMEDHPDITVRVVKVPEKDDHLARLTTAFAAGDPPDLFLVNFREYSQFVVRGAIEPVEPFIRGANISLTDYYTPPIEAFTYDGQLQCFPQNISSLVVYYNRTLFQEAGIEHPQEWGWEEFRQAALDLTKGDVHGLGLGPEIIRVAPFAWSNGGDIVDAPTEPSRFTLEQPESREALEFLVSLVRDDGVVPSERDVAAQDLETRFINGKLGMVLSSRRDTPVFREVLGLDWDVAPLPIAEAPAGILHSDAYCMSAQGEHHTESFEYLRFAVGEQGQTIAALGGRTVPSLKSVATSGAFLDPSQPPEHSQVFLDGIPFIRRTPVIPTWPEIEDISAEILTRAFYEEGYTIDDAIRELDEQTRELFEEGAPG